MATPLASIEHHSRKGVGLGGAMSGRFDGNHSTIGNTPKYTPAHDCRSLENAQRFGKSRGGQLPARVVRLQRPVHDLDRQHGHHAVSAPIRIEPGCIKPEILFHVKVSETAYSVTNCLLMLWANRSRWPTSILPASARTNASRTVAL